MDVKTSLGNRKLVLATVEKLKEMGYVKRAVRIGSQVKDCWVLPIHDKKVEFPPDAFSPPKAD
jgi:hypothetical protein